MSTLITAITNAFSADPFFTLMSSASNFGAVVPVGGHVYEVFATDNKTPVARVRANALPAGGLALVSYERYIGNASTRTAQPVNAALKTAMAAAFAADAHHALLAGGTVGKVVATGGNQYDVYDPGGKFVIATVTAIAEPDGSLQLISYIRH